MESKLLRNSKLHWGGSAELLRAGGVLCGGAGADPNDPLSSMGFWGSLNSLHIYLQGNMLKHNLSPTARCFHLI